MDTPNGHKVRRVLEFALLLALAAALIQRMETFDTRRFQDSNLKECLEQLSERSGKRLLSDIDEEQRISGVYKGGPEQILQQILEESSYNFQIAPRTVTVGASDWYGLPPCTISLEEQSLAPALKAIADKTGSQIDVGPTVRGQVSGKFDSKLPLEIVDELLKAQPEKLVWTTGGENVLAIHAPGQRPPSKIRTDCFPIPPDGIIRMEHILEHAPADRVLSHLRAKYPGLTFQPHPVLNGFYVKGKKEEHLKIKEDVSKAESLYR